MNWKKLRIEGLPNNVRLLCMSQDSQGGFDLVFEHPSFPSTDCYEPLTEIAERVHCYQPWDKQELEEHKG